MSYRCVLRFCCFQVLADYVTKFCFNYFQNSCAHVNISLEHADLQTNILTHLHENSHLEKKTNWRRKRASIHERHFKEQGAE